MIVSTCTNPEASEVTNVRVAQAVGKIGRDFDAAAAVVDDGRLRTYPIGNVYLRAAIARVTPMGHTRPSMDETGSVELTVATAALLNAIGQLAIHFPLKFHGDAWRVLTAELAQREIGLAPNRPIVLARQHYDALPVDVKAALRGTTR